MSNDKKKSPAQQGKGIVEFLRKLFGKREEKNYVVKQYSITISGFTTQLEAYRLADDFQKCFAILPETITISEANLFISQAEYKKYLEAQNSKNTQSKIFP